MVKKNIEVDETPIGMIMRGTPKASKPVSESARISMLTNKDLKESLRKIAWTQRKTLNQLINSINEEYVKEHQADIKEYDRLNK